MHRLLNIFTRRWPFYRERPVIVQPWDEAFFYTAPSSASTAQPSQRKDTR